VKFIKVKRAELANYTMLGSNQKTIPNDHYPAEAKYIPGLLVIVTKAGKIYGVPDSNILSMEIEEDPTAEPKPAQAQAQQQGKR
jgi:hypothetical protein